MFIEISYRIKPKIANTEYELALQYEIDPNEYMNKHNFINNLGDGKTKEVQPEILWLNGHFDGVFSAGCLRSCGNNSRDLLFDFLTGSALSEYEALVIISNAFTEYANAIECKLQKSNGNWDIDESTDIIVRTICATDFAIVPEDDVELLRKLGDIDEWEVFGKRLEVINY